MCPTVISFLMFVGLMLFYNSLKTIPLSSFDIICENNVKFATRECFFVVQLKDKLSYLNSFSLFSFFFKRLGRYCKEMFIPRMNLKKIWLILFEVIKNTKNREIVKSFLLILPLLVLTAMPGRAQQEKHFAITHGPYLQNLSDTGVIIVFTTNGFAVPGVLIRSDTGEFHLVRNSTDGLMDVGKSLHKIRIENLKPGKQYEYKLYAKEILVYKPYECVFGDTVISAAYHLRTFDPASEEIHFTVFCDLHDQSGKLGAYLKTNDIAGQDFYFMNGDILSYIVDEKQIFSSFIDTCVNRFAAEKPFFYVRGNHETRGMFARELKNYLAFPDGRYYYSLNAGPVHFIVLDGGEDKADTDKEYFGMADFDRYRLEELEWLKKEVRTESFKNAAFRIVVVHMPIIQRKDNLYGMAFLAEHYGPVLQNADIDLMISGHMHQNSWIKPDRSGFGYPVMISSNNNYIESTANREEIKLYLKNIKGEVVNNYTLKRKRP